MSNRDVFNRFIGNHITKAIVIGGLEPVLQWNEIVSLISYFRRKSCTAEFVIYTGYYPNEIEHELNDLRKFSNIVMKFGRFVPGHSSHYDEVLGVFLASDNQYGERIS